MLSYLIEHTPRFSDAPKAFGRFHVISLGIVLVLFALMIVFRHRLPKGEKALRRSLAVFGVGLLLLEIGKQLFYSYQGESSFAYNWEKFPFQFCSVPIYVALLAMCLREGKLRSALVAFLGTYSPVAGASVLFYPSNTVFSEIIFLDVHTMVWHGAMLLFGLYLWLSGEIQANVKTAGYAALVYAPLNFIALALNEASYAWGFAGEYTFNMFYTGRYGECYIPVLSTIQKTCPYPIFFVSYVVVLGVGGWLVTLVMMGIDRIFGGRKSSTQA